jgi:ribosomal protein S18 acetylase RimI-like enzyme
MASAASSSSSSSSESNLVKQAPLEVIITNSHPGGQLGDVKMRRQNTWDVVNYLQVQIANPDCHNSFWFNLSSITNSGNCLFVAREKQEGKLVGYLLGEFYVRHVDDGDRARGVILIVETCEGWRNRGVGRQLVAEFENYIIQVYGSHPWISMHESCANDPLDESIAFWEKLGYKKVHVFSDVFVKKLTREQ